jgi:hypothetical protein
MHKKILSSIIVLAWLVTMGVLIQKHYGNLEESDMNRPVSSIPSRMFEEQWMGAYLNEEKIGYVSRKLDHSNGGFRTTESLKLKLKILGMEKIMESILNADLDEDLKLQSFHFQLRSDINLDISGNVEGKTLTVSILSGNRKSSKTIELKKVPSLSISAVPALLKGGLTPGKEVSLSVFDPTLMSIEDMDVEVVGKETLMSMGIMREVYKLQWNFKGSKFVLWLAEDGEVLKEESPTGFLLVRESKEDAMKLGKHSLDLLAQIAVPFDRVLPGNTGYLKVKISGIDPGDFEMDGGRQILQGDILEIRKEVISPESVARPQQSKSEYLEETIFIQTKDPEIVSLSEAIVSGEKDTIRAANLIHDWIYENIEKVPSITLPMATDVLQTKRGDCNEHTTLYTALSRAAGIPTRISVGLVYEKGFFYYHAWPEIFSGRWIAIDPTLGQFPADASHIRLLTGGIDKQSRILSVVGKIKVEGIDHW